MPSIAMPPSETPIAVERLRRLNELVKEALALPAGVHRADLRRTGQPATAPPALSGSFTVQADQRVTVAALLDADTKPSWLAFPDDAKVTDVARGELRVRHFAATGPVAVTVDGEEVFVPPGSFTPKIAYQVAGEEVDVLTLGDVVVTIGHSS